MAKGRRHNQTGRSVGSRRWLQLDYQMLRSPAFIALTPIARAVLIAVGATYNGFNNGSIGFGIRDGARWGLRRTATARGIIELIAAGFLRRTQEGAFTTKRKAAEYRITWRDSEAGGPSTNDYRTKNTSPAGGSKCPAGGSETLLEAKRCA
jgi:hypothetical protein